MFGKVFTSAILGVDGARVSVEADFGDGLPAFEMVGFLGSEVKEARERVKSALKNSDIIIPPGRLTLNLSPADLRKQGNSFDLPIALSIMISLGILPPDVTSDYSFVGELSLDGKLRPVHGALSHVLSAKELGFKGCILPLENALETAIFPDMKVYGFKTLPEVRDFLLNPEEFEPVPLLHLSETSATGLDFSDVFGQESVKRAAMIASAGMHGFLMIGPPGSGKTLTAKRIPSILPPLTERERIESSKIHSVAGTLKPGEALLSVRPFRAPHHTISANGLVGGGVIPRPGEMSLAHNGVLFLDELPEFSKMTLEVMRQPLEDHYVRISRVNGTYLFPTRVMLVAAMNPCKCGYYPDRNRCQCSDRDVRMYLSRISKPLLDRIDISVEVPRVPIEDLTNQKLQHSENSKSLREKVFTARKVQEKRYQNENIIFNSELSGALLRKYCSLNPESSDLMQEVFHKTDLSARAHDRILKVARTIADIDESENIETVHLSEAISYRLLDRKFWGN